MNNFLPHYKYAKNQANKITNNRELAEDLVQDVFLKICKNKTELIGHKNFKGYLSLAIRNQYINHYRKYKKIKFNDIEEYNNTFFTSPYSDVLSDDLKIAIGCLSEKLKLPFILNVIYGYLDPEVATMLDIPIGTVKNRIFKAKAFLRKKLTEKK